jgi:hypothetical protein
MRLFACWLLIAASCSLCSIASAQGVIDMGTMPEQEAMSHFKVGKSLYEAGRFAEAAREFANSYELSKRPELLYNIYVSYRDASDGPNAIEALRRYLELATLDDATRVNLQARLRAMQQANAGKEPPPPEQTSPPVAAALEQPAPVEPAPVPEPVAPEPAESASPVPFVLLGVGGALVIGGAITGAIVLGKESDLKEACPSDRCSNPDDLDKRDSAHTLAIVTDALIAGGVVLAGVGAVLLLLDDSSEQSSAQASAKPGFACGLTGCMASVTGRF